MRAMRRGLATTGLLLSLAGQVIWRGGPADLDRAAEPFFQQFVSGLPEGPLTESVGR